MAVHFRSLLGPVSTAVLALGACLSLEVTAWGHSTVPDFMPCAPSSEYLDGQIDVPNGGLPPDEGAPVPRVDFCAEWNPEFPFNGHHCCSRVVHWSRGRRRHRRGSGKVCPAGRFKPDFCGDMTPEQKSYIDAVSGGKIPDVLDVITRDMGRHGDQSFCGVNNGFLAWGRPIVPTDRNRIELRAAERCTNYGTDVMAGMMEWVGRQVSEQYGAPEYSGVRLLLGDVSAPRGGCLAGRSGRVGHASHTTGQDADVGYLTVKADGRSPSAFHTGFDAKANWWLIKQFFKNPYACVKVIFLDRRNIRKLAKAARDDEDWVKYARFVRHMPGHRNHMHVRVGEGPGQPGCSADSHPELEMEEDSDYLDTLELEQSAETRGLFPRHSDGQTPSKADE